MVINVSDIVFNECVGGLFADSAKRTDNDTEMYKAIGQGQRERSLEEGENKGPVPRSITQGPTT